MDYQDSMFEIRPSGDYLHVICTRCRTDCEMDFKSRDAVMANEQELSVLSEAAGKPSAFGTKRLTRRKKLKKPCEIKSQV